MSVELRVVRGDATPEELAAVVAVLVASTGAPAAAEPPAAPSLWSRPQLREPLHAGLGAWRASGLPR